MPSPKVKKLKKKIKSLEAKKMSAPRKSPRSNRPKKSAPTGVREAKLMSIPASYGAIVPGVSLQFLKSRNSECMRVFQRNFVGTAGVDSSGNTVFNIVSGVTPRNNGGQWYFNPSNAYYASSSPMQIMSGYFLQYYVNRLKLIFYSKVGANTAGTVTTGTEDDPLFFETSGVANSTTNPTKLLVSQMQFAKSCNVWLETFEVPFKIDSRQKYFIRGDEGTGGFISYSDIAADQRQTYSNCMGLNYDGAAASTAATFHDIYIEYDIEFCGLSSGFQVATFSANKRNKVTLDRVLERLEALEKGDKKEKTSDSDFESL